MPVNVLYIAGLGRSGSTLMARLLGEVAGVINTGECILSLFSSDMYDRGIPCSCTKRPEECEFWHSIASSVTGSDRVLAARTIRLRRMFASKEAEDMVAMRGRIAEVYTQVAEASSAEVIVDASKHPAIPRLAAECGDIRVQVVHLVRDPRSVVASRQEAKSYLRAINPLLTSVRWSGFNLGSEWLAGKVAGFDRVRYEDFVLDPSGTLSAVMQSMLGTEPALDFIRGDHASVGQQHALAGNPDKLGTHDLVIRPDSKSVDGLLHWGVTASTLPLLIRYRYPLLPRSIG